MYKYNTSPHKHLTTTTSFDEYNNAMPHHARQIQAL